MQHVHIFENKEDILADAVPFCISYKCLLLSIIIFANLKQKPLRCPYKSTDARSFILKRKYVKFFSTLISMCRPLIFLFVFKEISFLQMRQGWTFSILPLRSDLSFPLPPAFRNSRKSTWKHCFLSNCYYLFSLWFPLIGEVLCLLPSKNIWKDCHEHFGTFLLCQHPCLVLCVVWHFFVFIATTKEWVLVSFPFLQMRKVRLQAGPWLVAKISGTKEPGLEAWGIWLAETFACFSVQWVHDSGPPFTLGFCSLPHLWSLHLFIEDGMHFHFFLFLFLITITITCLVQS